MILRDFRCQKPAYCPPESPGIDLDFGDGFAPDSPLEGAGFEPSVPLEVLTVGIVPCRLRGRFLASLLKTKFAADSALEEGGFEPSVPPLSELGLSRGGTPGGRAEIRTDRDRSSEACDHSGGVARPEQLGYAGRRGRRIFGRHSSSLEIV